MRCPRCDHNTTYMRIVTREIVCKNCGFVGSPDTRIEEKDKIRTIRYIRKEEK